MARLDSKKPLLGSPWTVGIAAVLLVLNLGVIAGTPAWTVTLLELLQYDRQAILAGEWWRLVAGNLVHWSWPHFALDIGVFLVVGLLYERALPSCYPWLLLGISTAIGLALLLFQPDMELYRGLSGVDSGQFALALGVELSLCRQDRRRWLWVTPAAILFVMKLVFECGTGQLLFGTEALGDIGSPVPLAHAVGAGAGGLAWWMFSRENESRFLALGAAATRSLSASQ